MRWLSILIRNLLAAVLGFFALPWCLGLLIDAVQRHQHWPRFPLATCLGFALGVVLIFLRKPNMLLHTFVHECCHALMCLVLFVKLRGMSFTDGRGGKVEYNEPRDRVPWRALLITIAPYTIPLLLGPALLARWWWHNGLTGEILSGVCAFLFVTHLQGLALNVRLNFWGSDADLPKVGRFLSLVLISGVLLLVTTATVNVLWQGGAVRQGLAARPAPPDEPAPSARQEPVEAPAR